MITGPLIYITSLTCLTLLVIWSVCHPDLCPKCGHSPDSHNYAGCWHRTGRYELKEDGFWYELSPTLCRCKLSVIEVYFNLRNKKK
jgi:hypothetical protein